MTKSPKLSPADLRQFSGGTTHYYRHGLNRSVTFSDGAKPTAPGPSRQPMQRRGGASPAI